MKTLLTNRSGIALCLLFFVLVLVSCQKEQSTDPESTTAVSEEEAGVYADESVQAEGGFDDVEDISMIAAEEEGDASVFGRAETGRYHPLFPELRIRIGNCATITVTPNDSTYPKTITIDFGPNGCLCPDGKYRRGKVVIHLTKPIRRPGAVMTITLVDFFLNRASVKGTKVVTNLSTAGQVKFTVQVVGGKVTFPNGRGYMYNSLKVVKQIEGAGTRIIRDDVFSIEGRSKTEFNNGVTVNLDTESPLIKKVICPWISQGILKIKINSRIFLLDFSAPSNGDCDNKALLTWNNGGNSRLITLP